MTKASQEFRHDLAKEMRDKIKERDKKLKEIDAMGLNENIKNETKKEIMKTFYEEVDEMKKRPGYEEARKEHLKEIQEKIKNKLKPENQKLLEELKNAKDIERRVQLFVTLTDKIPLDALVGLIPFGSGDITMAVVSSVYLVYFGRKIGLERTKIAGIVGLQAIDAIIGFFDLGGNIADYFFKANKFSAKFFTQKVEELKNEAKKRGIDPKKIAEITQEFEGQQGPITSVFQDIIDDLEK